MSEVQITDLYEVTMAHSYLREGMTAPATFSLFVRKMPPGRGFLVAAGLEAVLDHLTHLRVDEEDVAAFAAALHRPYAELEPMLGLRFTGEVRAVPEGRIMLAGEPLLEITAPLPEAQLVETYVLNQVCHQTAVASKSARCVIAAQGRPVVDFSLRRTHGVQAGEQAARLGALVGFAGTSNVAAARKYGLRAVGTMAHSYIEAFGDEAAAFRAFAQAHPGPVTLLVDTYDTEEGVAVAARVFRELGLSEGCAVRLDSGDLGALAVAARRILDAAGLAKVRITASGGLDEYGLDALVRAGAPIDLFAVGTLVGVSADAPYLDAAYKLVCYDGQSMMKFSPGKATAPGAKQVLRSPGFVDTVALGEETSPDGARSLLETVMTDGLRTGPPPSLADSRATFEGDLAELPPAARRIHDPEAPQAVTSRRLRELTAKVRNLIEARLPARAAEPGGAAPPRDAAALSRRRRRHRVGEDGRSLTGTGG